MKKVLVVGPGKLVFVEEVEPEMGPGDVQIRISQTGLSSRSEIERYVRNPAGKPEGIGYNAVGVIEACGADVTRFQPGDRVFTTVGHADMAVVDANKVIRIPDAVDDASACFAYLPTLGMHALRLANYQPGEFVAISGQGIIGQTAGLMARLYGARTIAIDVSDERLALATRCGAHVTINPLQEDIQSAIGAFCGSAGLDIVIDTASSWVSLSQSLDIIRPRGRVVMLGIIREVPNETDSTRFYDAYRRNMHGKEAVIIGASNDPQDPAGSTGLRFTWERNIEEVMDHIQAGSLNVKQLITHRYPISEIEDVYRLLLNGGQDHLGVVFTWPT